jgi:hypothetical protein
MDRAQRSARRSQDVLPSKLEGVMELHRNDDDLGFGVRPTTSANLGQPLAVSTQSRLSRWVVLVARCGSRTRLIDCPPLTEGTLQALHDLASDRQLGFF